jgi:ABC-type polysaccharide/polyol phosphate export permease
MVKIFKDLYNYRELLNTNVRKEIRGKYKGAWLGIVWSFLNPLLMLLIYAIVFPYILRIEVENYTMYLMVALIPWNFFTTVVQLGAGSIVNNGNILKKVYFPREIIPISVVTSGLINYLITFLIVVIFLLFSGIGISWTLLLFPVIAIIQYILILGLTFALSALTVYIRDLEHFVGVFLLMMFYVTPVIYNPEMLPVKFEWVLKINPMAYIIEAYRDILYYKQLPDMLNLSVIAVMSIAFLIVGFVIFKKLERNFAEEL